MICLFHLKTKREVVIERNGDYVIDKYVTRSLITEKMDGTYEFNFTMLNNADYKLLDLVCKGSIVKTNDEHGDEIFRIESVKKDKKYIEVYARQITIDETLSLWLEDVRPKNLNGQATLSYLIDNAIGKTELIVSSDIAKNNTAYYVRKNMYEALACEDTAFLNRWGGEIKRRGYTLYINSRIGMDKGFSIESRKNLLGFNIKEENTVITAIKPMGFDGITTDIVYSKHKDDYPRLYVKEIKWEDVKLKSEEEPDGYETLAEAQAELKKRAEKEFTENKIDLIQATYEIDFIELAKTEEYKNIKSVQSAAIGDDVTVWIDTYGLELKARVTERQYSPTLDRRIKTTLSTRINTTVPPKPSDILQQIQQQLPPNKLPTLENYIDSMITSGFKNSYYISRPNEALWLDNPDINKAVNVVRMNKNGLGFSQTGYYGKYVYGFTIDGKINADLITVGQLNGALIKAGTLTADKIEVSFKEEIKNDVEDLIKNEFGEEVKEEIKNDVTNIVLKDYVTKSEFLVDKNGLTNKIEGVREEITTKVTEVEGNTDKKIKEVNNTITKLDTKFSTVNGVIQQQVSGQSETIQNIYGEIEGQQQRLLETNKIISQSVSNLTTDINGVKANVKDVTKITNETKNNLEKAKEKIISTESSLNVLKGEVNSKVTKKEVEQEISNIKIGGVNLIPNSDKFKVGVAANGIYSYLQSDGSLKVVSYSYNGNWFTSWATDLTGIEEELSENEPFVISFTMKSPDTTDKPTIYIKSGMGYYKMNGTMSNEYSTFYYSGRWKKNNPIVPHLGFSNIEGTFYIKNWKIEKGNKVTDWSPSPKDAQKSIKEFSSELKQTADGLSAKVSSLTTTTNKINGNVATLDQRLDTTEQKITPTGIISQVNTAIRGGSQINSVSTILDKNGFTVNNGAITVNNQQKRKVFWVDTTGQLCTDNIHIFGEERLGNLDIRGTGNKGVSIRSHNVGDRYIDFTTQPFGTSYEDETLRGNFTRLVARKGDFYISPSNNLYINNVNIRNPRLTSVNIDSTLTETTGELKSKTQLSSPKGYISKIYTFNTPNVDFESPTFFRHDAQFGAKLKVSSLYDGSGTGKNNINVYSNLYMMNGKGVIGGRAKFENLKINEPIPFAYNTEKENIKEEYSVVKTKQNILELIGNTDIKEQEEYFIEFDKNIAYKNYVVLLTPIGENKSVSITKKEENGFYIKGDKCEVDYCIKFNMI